MNLWCVNCEGRGEIFFATELLYGPCKECNGRGFLKVDDGGPSIQSFRQDVFDGLAASELDSYTQQAVESLQSSRT